MEKTGRKRKTYSQDFKMAAVRMYLEQGMGYKTVARELEINASMVRNWIKNYKSLGPKGLEERRGKTKTPFTGRPRIKQLPLEQEVERLRTENEFLKKLRSIQRG